MQCQNEIKLNTGKLVALAVWLLIATVLGMAYKSNLLALLVSKRYVQALLALLPFLENDHGFPQI